MLEASRTDEGADDDAAVFTMIYAIAGFEQVAYLWLIAVELDASELFAAAAVAYLDDGHLAGILAALDDAKWIDSGGKCRGDILGGVAETE